MNKLLALVPLTLAQLVSTGCSSSSGSSGCPAGAVCDTGTPTGASYGTAADGTVSVTAIEAWPNRPMEPEPLTAPQIAEACALEGACTKSLYQPDTTQTVDDFMATLTALCAQPSGDEERVIPQGGSNERWSWEKRAALSVPLNCDTILALKTKPAPGFHCEEDGCWWNGGELPVPTVTCTGDVATLTYSGGTTTRDCGHSYTHCDPSSATGCTDRAPVGCDPSGRDKCDGDIKLGCDHMGRVSYHDCSLFPGGRCVQSSTGASCAYDTGAPSDCTTGTAGACSGDVLSVCVTGHTQQVDCKKLGLTGCNAGHCVM